MYLFRYDIIDIFVKRHAKIRFWFAEIYLGKSNLYIRTLAKSILTLKGIKKKKEKKMKKQTNKQTNPKLNRFGLLFLYFKNQEKSHNLITPPPPKKKTTPYLCRKDLIFNLLFL